ncbi:MAG: helix-turn-helix domain-containing protein [Mycobacteriaceae bacterium]
MPAPTPKQGAEARRRLVLLVATSAHLGGWPPVRASRRIELARGARASSPPTAGSSLLTASEASALLGIPRSTLYELARRGALPARQIGRRWIFRRSLLDRDSPADRTRVVVYLPAEHLESGAAAGRRRPSAPCRKLAAPRCKSHQGWFRSWRRAMGGWWPRAECLR